MVMSLVHYESAIQTEMYWFILQGRPTKNACMRSEIIFIQLKARACHSRRDIDLINELKRRMKKSFSIRIYNLIRICRIVFTYRIHSKEMVIKIE